MDANRAQAASGGSQDETGGRSMFAVSVLIQGAPFDWSAMIESGVGFEQARGVAQLSKAGALRVDFRAGVASTKAAFEHVDEGELRHLRHRGARFGHKRQVSTRWTS